MIKIPEEESEREEKKMPAGGYVCRIVKATTGVNRYDEPCLLLYLDVEEGEFKNYFGRIYERRLDRGLDIYPCVYKQSVGSRSMKHFERLINAITASNDGYIYTGKVGEDWDESELENLLVGVVFQEKEFVNSHDKIRVISIPYGLTSVEAIRCGDFVIPARRYE